MIINTVNHFSNNSVNRGVMVNNSDAALIRALKLYVQMLLDKNVQAREMIERLQREKPGPRRQLLLTEITRQHESTHDDLVVLKEVL